MVKVKGNDAPVDTEGNCWLFVMGYGSMYHEIGSGIERNIWLSDLPTEHFPLNQHCYRNHLYIKVLQWLDIIL